MDLVRKLIEERAKALGIAYTELSRRLGRNETYIQQFLKKGSPRELRERERAILAEVLQVPEDDLRGPSSPLPKRSYERKTTSARDNLLDPITPTSQGRQGNAASHVPVADLFGAYDLPVHGTAPGGRDGALIVSETAVDWAPRPVSLARVRNAYGLIVSDDTMSPEYRMGAIIAVNPHLPGRVGYSSVFRGLSEDGHELAIIRELRGQTETHWKVHQHHPMKDYTLRKSDWPNCQRVVMTYIP